MSSGKLRPETTYQAVIGRVIVNFRKQLAVDQALLAGAAGVTQSTWSRIERGESSLSIEQLAKADEVIEEVEVKYQPAQILAAMQKLTPAYRTIFNLYVFDNLTHREIAEQLGINEGTSKSNYAKAKRNLKKILENGTY